MPANVSITAKLSPPRQKGMGFALREGMTSIVRMVAPLVAAFIGSSLGLFPIFLASSIVFFIGLIVLHLGVKVD